MRRSIDGDRVWRGRLVPMLGAAMLACSSPGSSAIQRAADGAATSAPIAAGVAHGDASAPAPGASATPAFRLCDRYSAPVAVGQIEDPRLVELSGLAASWRNPGVLWAVADSGNPAVVYALGPTGTVLGGLRLVGAVNTDWEDVAVGACGQGSCIYVADIGDNLGLRATKRVLRVAEPAISVSEPFGDRGVSSWEVMGIRFGRGQRLGRYADAEALAVLPDGGLVVAVKVGEGANVELYASPYAAGEQRELTRLPDRPVPDGRPLSVTAAAAHPSGGALLIRGNRAAFEWRSSSADGRGVAVPAAREQQGEAIAYLPGGGYAMASERPSGRPSRLSVVRCAEAVTRGQDAREHARAASP